MKVVADGKSTNNFEIVDDLGTTIENVVSFDPDTEEVEILVTGKPRAGGVYNPAYTKVAVVTPYLQDADAADECCAPAAYKAVTFTVKIPGAKLVTK